MPFLGDGKFRFEDCRIVRMQGIGFAKSLNNSVLADIEQIFRSRAELTAYLGGLAPRGAATAAESRLLAGFLQGFCDFIVACPPEELGTSWANKTARTDFYCSRAMPAVAKSLGLEHGVEEFTVDYVMSKAGRNGRLVPQVYIESENEYGAASQEIRKLCSLNSPLRVLITVTGKEFRPDAWSPGHQNLREWQDIVRAHAEDNPYFNGVIAVIIGRRDAGKLVFQCCAFDRTGDLLKPLSPLVSRSLTGDRANG
jgi:hypothetical protein